MLDKSISQKFKKLLKEPGFVFAYPTEAVFGLGGNPLDELAFERILRIKQRPSSQRFLLIASSWEQVLSYIQLPPPHLLKPVQDSWPGPVTWVFKAAPHLPSWLKDENNTIAIRITAHPIAHALCEIAEHPLFSTSANIHGQPPCRTFEEVEARFNTHVDQTIPGFVNMNQKPSSIRDVESGKILR